MKKIKIALIGAGYISDYHARGLQSITNVEITTVVARTLESAKKFAQKYGIVNFTTDIDAVYKSKEVDAAIISTPNQFHARIFVQRAPEVDDKGIVVRGERRQPGCEFGFHVNTNDCEGQPIPAPS